MSARTRAYRKYWQALCWLALGMCFALCAVAPAGAGQSSQSPGQATQTPQQQSLPAPPAATPNTSNAAEMSTTNTTVPLQSHVNVVPLRVVVRDAKGQPIANLRKEDFQIFEDGKPQDISHFSIETPASVSQTILRDDVVEPSGTAKPNFVPPSSFVALLFDDVHVTTQDLMRARQAATRFVNSALQSTDRVAVYTISGQSQMEFTADRDKLEQALNGLMVRPVGAVNTSDPNQCPPIDYYEANLIQNNLDPTALQVATQDALACAYQNDPDFAAEAQMLAQSTATQVYEAGQSETEYSLRRLEEAVRRLSSLPGQRVLVLVSPGFIYPEREVDVSRLIDQANRESVFINTLDARGLYTLDSDATDTTEVDPTNPGVSGRRDLFRISAQNAESDVLAVLADGTGGMDFHNNNDLTGGLQMIAGAPSVSYLIAFTPRNFKYDGKFHSLKVKIPAMQHVTIEARRGFYAPKHSLSVDEAAKEEIEEALFSQDIETALPIGVHTQYYKVDAADAKLAVMAHIDLAHLRFQKAAGRNDDDVTIVTALFDRDGNIVSGIQKTVQMRLRDTTLERLSQTGITVQSSFDVKAGDYLVRLVVRDSNAAQLSTQNDAVEIPY
jgi:VWFA-related protein